MPIKIPNDLPAVKTLQEENIFVMTETRASTPGHPPAADRPAESDAHEDRHGDAALPPAGQHAAAGRAGAGADLKSHEAANTLPATICSRSTKRLTISATSALTAWSSPARRWSRCPLRTWIIGRSCARSWSGARRMSTARCTSAGARRRGCIIITAFEKQPLAKKLFGVFPHRVEYKTLDPVPGL